MGLAAPLFLLGLALLALPFLLHRLSEQQSERRAFSSLMFMRAGREQRLVRTRLRHLLLLMMKLLAVAIAVVAFARPFVESSEAPPAVDRSMLHVIVLDSSMSMGIGDRWQRARARAADVISAMDRADEVMLVAAAGGLDVLAAPSAEPASVSSALARAAPGDERLDFAGLLRRAASTARAVADAEAALHLHLVSDFQRSAAAARFGDLPAGADVAFTLHDVGASPADNWAVEQIRTLHGEKSTIEVAVKSFAATEDERDMELRLDGERIGAATLRIPAGGRGAHRFTGIEAPRGDSPIEALLEGGDALRADDLRRAVVVNRDAQSVLLMTRGAVREDALYVQAALAASPELGFRAELAVPERWDELNLADFPLVVLSDPPLLDAALTRRLERYLDGGGAALIFLGDESLRNGRIALTGHVLRSPSSLGGEEFVKVADADESHPVSVGARQWSEVSFYEYLDVALLDADRVLARLEGGAPLLIEHAFGLGRVIIFTSALDRSWSNLSVEPVFIPWVNGTIRYLSGLRRTQLEERVVGARFDVSSAGVQLFDPDGEKLLSLAETLGGTDVVLDRLGFYEVNIGGESRLMAVNFDLRESDPRPMDPRALTRWQSASAQPTRREVTVERSAGSPRELWPWLMAALLIVIVAESLGGNWLLRKRVTV